jgi:hypothetical protein
VIWRSSVASNQTSLERLSSPYQVNFKAQVISSPDHGELITC